MPDFFLCSCHVVDVSAGHSFHSDSVYFPISQLPAADGDNSLASISFHFFCGNVYRADKPRGLRRKSARHPLIKTHVRLLLFRTIVYCGELQKKKHTKNHFPLCFCRCFLIFFNFNEKEKRLSLDIQKN